MFKRKKKYYREVKCLACNGTGRQIPLAMGGKFLSSEEFKNLQLMAQGICISCQGKGTQTVLDREE